MSIQSRQALLAGVWVHMTSAAVIAASFGFGAVLDLECQCGCRRVSVLHRAGLHHPVGEGGLPEGCAPLLQPRHQRIQQAVRTSGTANVSGVLTADSYRFNSRSL